MRSVRRSKPSRQGLRASVGLVTSGFTLIELLLALALVSVLFVALMRLMDTTMTIWERTETGREINAVSGGVLDLLQRDLVALEGGPRGDLLFQWVLRDVDRDGVATAPFPILRFVRQASAADLLSLDPQAAIDPRAIDLIEVCWALVPSAGDSTQGRAVAVLLRGARRLSNPDSLSFFDEDFLDSAARPLAGAMEEVSGGVLWVAAQFATQTSIVHDSWEAGDELKDVSRSWDAWARGRPDRELTDWNRPHAGVPATEGSPRLPRRIRLELEIERPAELRRRPHLEQSIEKDEVRIALDDDRRMPNEGMYLLVDEEWMRVTAVKGAHVVVRRGARSTRPAPHASGAQVHFGRRQVRDVAVALYREDWDL